MKNEPKFYIDKDTNLIVEVITNQENTDLPGKYPSLTELIPNTSEGAAEKHLPVIERDNRHITVNVGSILHPMSEEHCITWVYLQTKSGGQRVYLKSDSEPVAHFVLQEGDDAVAAYAYCNLHGFWKSELS